MQGITLEQAKAIRRGAILNHSRARPNADGTPARYKVSSVKTWKTRPTQVRITAHYGIHASGWYTFTEEDLEHLTIQRP